MSGRPRRVRQGATLTLVFGVVLMAGAASGAWGEPLTVPLPPSMDAAAQLAAVAEFFDELGARMDRMPRAAAGDLQELTESDA